MTEVMHREVHVQTLKTYFTTHAPIVMENDKIPALNIRKSLGSTEMSNFIDMRHKYLKQTIWDKEIKLIHAQSNQLQADIFSKSLDMWRFEKLRNMIAVKETPSIKHNAMHGPPNDYSSSGGVWGDNAIATVYETLSHV